MSQNTAASYLDFVHKPCQKPSSLTRPACCQPASVTLLPNNWRGHLRWPMTSLVVHFCSAPLVCFVDALDTSAIDTPAKRTRWGKRTTGSGRSRNDAPAPMEK